MDAYDRCTNLGKNLADNVAIYSRGREIFRPPTYEPYSAGYKEMIAFPPTAKER
jgi:hypothetical protein